MNAPPQIISTVAELTTYVRSLKQAGRSIGIVPTMGALHAGHVSLAEASVAQTDVTIASIFVNPTQFAAGEDLPTYPRTLDEDLAKLASVGVDVVFEPAENEMYPAGYTTSILPPRVSASLEGESRPTHFAGVATVVLKLLNVTQADVAFFGQKDYQQSLVVRRMVQDLNVPVRIEVCPIVREPDGLAMSSRNVYLSAEERVIALTLKRTLDLAESQIREGQRDGFELITEMRQSLIDGGVTSIDYAAVVHADTLATLDPIELPCVALVAAHVGNTRLIDNCVIQ